MRKWNSGYWVGIGIALVIVFAGLGTLVFWLVNKDAAYIPLAAAIVSGTATLTGVAIGALVLRFNYRSQANPLRLELYKKRTDALVTIYETIAPLRYLYLKHVDYTTPDCKAKPEIMKDVNDKLEEIKKLRRKLDLILPEDVIKVLAVFTASVRDHAWELVNSGVNNKTASKGGHYHRMHESHNDFINRCRKHIGTKEISDGIIELLGVDIQPFNDPMSHEDRIRRMLGLPNDMKIVIDNHPERHSSHNDKK